MVSRVILAIVGVVLVVAGVLAGAVAVWGYTSIGTDGLVRIPAGTVSPGPNARATIIDVDTFSVTAPYVGGLGSSELVVTSPDASAQAPLFLGAAATSDADAFLAGVPYSAAFRDGDGWTVREVPGGVALPAPATGTWLAQDTGVNPGIAVPADRPLSLVVLAPAGTALSSFDLAVAFTIPDASSWLLGLAIAAGVLVVAGAVLLFLGLRRRRTRGRHAAGAPVAGAPVAEPDAASDAESDASSDVAASEGDTPATTDDASPAEPDDASPAEPDDASPAEAEATTDADDTTELPAIVVAADASSDVAALEAGMATTTDEASTEKAEEPVDGVAFVIDVDEDAEPVADAEPDDDRP